MIRKTVDPKTIQNLVSNLITICNLGNFDDCSISFLIGRTNNYCEISIIMLYPHTL